MFEKYRQFELNDPNTGCDENNDRMDDDAVGTTTTAGPGSGPIMLRQYAFLLNVWAIRAVERTGLLKSKSELTAHDLRAKVTLGTRFRFRFFHRLQRERERNRERHEIG